MDIYFVYSSYTKVNGKEKIKLHATSVQWYISPYFRRQLTPISLAYPSMNKKQKAKPQTTKLNPHSLNAIATRKDDVQFESTKQTDKKLIRRK
jgi:hypothetical protein